MADDKIDNEQELEEAKPLSLFDEKMKGLLDELDAVSYTHLTLPTTPYV